MKRIDQQTVQRIIDSADIVEVVSDFVELKRRGANYMGLCPFHNERTPSFSVNRARGICKCFSCGEGGNAVNFVMKIKQCGYGEALRYLAAKYGIEIKEAELTEQQLRQRQERDALFAAVEAAAEFYAAQLQSIEGRKALEAFDPGSVLKGDLLKNYGAGYAPTSGSALINALAARGFTAKALVAAGLAVTDETGRTSDTFHGTLLTAVRGRYGRVLGFEAASPGAVMPDTAIWHREDEIAGLYEARGPIGRERRAVIAAHPADILWLAEGGIPYTLALTGGGFTEKRIEALKRLTTDLTLLLPPSKGGIFATLRAAVPLLAAEINVKVVALPAAPAQWVAHTSTEQVAATITDQAVDMVIYRINALRRAAGSRSQGAFRTLFDDIVYTLRQVVSPLLLEAYVNELADATGYSPSHIHRVLGR